MSVIGVPKSNVTLVAFLGDNKPRILNDILDEIFDLLPKDPNEFVTYKKEQIHATIIGMEAVVIGGKLYNANFLNKNGQLRKMNVKGLFEIIQAIAMSRDPLFTIRFGGFTKGQCTCTGFDLQDWDCKTSNSEFHSYGRSAYEGSFYAFSPGPAMLTGWPVVVNKDLSKFPRYLYGFRRAAEESGYLDSYHSNDKPHWKDDDCYIRLGTFGALPATKNNSIVQNVRDFLSQRKPATVDIGLQDLSIVCYKDTSLTNKRYWPLVDVLGNPNFVESLYPLLNYLTD